MLDEDVFDSVTWETPTANGYEVETPRVSSGPGFRQSIAGAEGGGPNEPKWEGYLITSVKDPLKELPDTKDAYVSYLVTAEVRVSLLRKPTQCSAYTDEPADIYYSCLFVSQTLSGLCFSQRQPLKGLPSLCGAPFARQASLGCGWNLNSP